MPSGIFKAHIYMRTINEENAEPQVENPQHQASIVKTHKRKSKNKKKLPPPPSSSSYSRNNKVSNTNATYFVSRYIEDHKVAHYFAFLKSKQIICLLEGWVR